MMKILRPNLTTECNESVIDITKITICFSLIRGKNIACETQQIDYYPVYFRILWIFEVSVFTKQIFACVREFLRIHVLS